MGKLKLIYLCQSNPNVPSTSKGPITKKKDQNQVKTHTADYIGQTLQTTHASTWNAEIYLYTKLLL